MKKIIKFVLSLTLALILVCSMSAGAFAAESSVEYEGNAQEFIFEPGSEYSPTDLFTDFKGVMPGDELNQTIRVKNDGAADVNVEIFIKAEGAVEDEEFLSQMNLVVTAPENKELFNAPADKTGGLTDWVSLGTFKKGADTELETALSVPVTMGNDFRDRIGKLNWKFKVNEYPVPEEAEPAGTAEPDESGNPSTGDRNSMAVPAVIGIIAAAGVVVMVIRRRNS